MNYNKSGFTLVELVVVITILGILGTIAFVSLQGYSRSARDANRISDINNIVRTLEVALTKTGRIPTPENALTINSSGSIIGHQGFAGEKTLASLGVHNGGKDPLDDEHYTYLTNSNFNRYQVVGFLENSSTVARNIGISEVYADDMSGRTVLSRGSQLGVIIDSNTSEPIQYGESNIDISDIGTNEYKVIFSNKSSIIGTSTDLASLEYTFAAGGISTNCAALLDQNPILSDGYYYIIDDNTGNIAPTFCDMTTNQGGWTYCSREGGWCQYDTSTGNDADILYISTGDRSLYRIQTSIPNGTQCNNTSLGGDVHNGVFKECFFR